MTGSSPNLLVSDVKTIPGQQGEGTGGGSTVGSVKKNTKASGTQVQYWKIRDVPQFLGIPRRGDNELDDYPNFYYEKKKCYYIRDVKLLLLKDFWVSG